MSTHAHTFTVRCDRRARALLTDDDSFETHIHGAVNPMRLGLSSPCFEPARFFFASSVSAVANWLRLELVPEAVTDNPAVAQEMR